MPPKKKAATQAHDSESMASMLWKAADKLRGNISPSHYKHPVLGLIFLKHVSDTFDERRAEIERLTHDATSDYYTDDEDVRREILEDRDEYVSHNVFWIPEDARWEHISNSAKQSTVAVTIDRAMEVIERVNKPLKGVLPKIYGTSNIDPKKLGGLIDLVSGIGFSRDGHVDHDILGRVYEYFLGQFSAIEGRAGEDYTPRGVVRLLVEMLEPYSGRVFDPCCGSGGMFVQSARFVEAHGGRLNDLSVFGQEYNDLTWKLARMNLALRGIEADLGDRSDDSLHRDLHPDLRADYIIANPPFNVSDWDGELLKKDPRWTHGVPYTGNANYAWVQHFLWHLAPSGTAGFVLANGALTSNQREEAAIRRSLVERGLVDCIVALPAKLFSNTAIPVSLWFPAKDDRDGTAKHRPRRGETLFIDARKLGEMISRRQRQFREADITKVADTYHSWRDKSPEKPYADVDGYCKSVKRDDIVSQTFILSPGRYVGTPEADEDEEAPYARLERLRKDLLAELDESAAIEDRLRRFLGGIG